MYSKNLLIAILCCFCNTIAHANDLFVYEKDNLPVENGKVLSMAYREVSRIADESLVEVDFRSGGSVSSSMFMLRGTCALAASRGEEFFKVSVISRAPITLKVRFFSNGATVTSANTPKDRVFSSAECKLIGY